MSSTFDLSELAENSSEWPKCPKCDSRSTLSGGQLGCCVRCGFMGAWDDLEQTALYRYARAKLSSRHMGHRGVLAMLENDIPDDFYRVVGERAAQLAQRLVHAPVFHQAARRLLEKGTFIPIAIGNYRPEDHKPQTLLLSEIERQRTLMKISTMDVASIIWHGNLVKDWSEPDEETVHDENRSVLVINTHFYNAPSHVRAIGVDWKGGVPSLGEKFPEHNDIQPHPLIWQPVYWPILTIEPGRIQPLYFAAMEIEEDVNINFAVCEDMDGAPLVRGVLRKPWSLEPPVVKDYPCDDAEEGVKLLKEKFAKAVEQSRGEDTGTLIFKQELEWDGDAHPWAISQQLRTAELWDHYQKTRK